MENINTEFRNKKYRTNKNKKRNDGYLSLLFPSFVLVEFNPYPQNRIVD
jgi:hypothetical protein